mmetsp:Transcript_73420/g.215300  ORF Transcript_73420/g.215300 Transcript_73420/m.215300 type:complete len:252 (+) Transcript_73420:605-1360(+)
MAMCLRSISARASGASLSAQARTSRMGVTRTAQFCGTVTSTSMAGTTACATTTCSSLTSRLASGAVSWCMDSARQDATSTRQCSARIQWSSLAAPMECADTTMSSSSTWRPRSPRAHCRPTWRPSWSKRSSTRQLSAPATSSLPPTTASLRRACSATRICSLCAASSCTILSRATCPALVLRTTRPWTAHTRRPFHPRPQPTSTGGQRLALARLPRPATRTRPSTPCSAQWSATMATRPPSTASAAPAAAR